MVLSRLPGTIGNIACPTLPNISPCSSILTRNPDDHVIIQNPSTPSPIGNNNDNNVRVPVPEGQGQPAVAVHRPSRLFLKQSLKFGPSAVNDQIQLTKYPDNTVSTTKYSLLTWLPKSLLFQFKRISNIYFLVITILQLMPFSPKQPASMIMTFALVLIFTSLKEGYEDYQRFKQDKEVNLKKTTVINQGRPVQKLWKDLRVGEIVKVLKDEAFPADLFLLKTSHPGGVAFVDTMNLDGESNLKEKLMVKNLRDFPEENIGSFQGSLECDVPNEYLDVWEATARINGMPPINFEFKQLLLRGTTLRNTEYVYGVIVYTGHHTKSMKNTKKTPPKMSSVLKLMNRVQYSVFIMEGIICFTFAISSISWQSEFIDLHYYIGDDGSVGFWGFIIKILTFLVAYSHLIPISLYVALEVLKLVQGMLIRRDKEMYYEEIGRGAIARTSDLVEELGQIEFIFSDKTGTLTRNEMIFKKCSIYDIVYGQTPDDPNATYSINGDTSGFRALCDNDRNPHKKAVHEFFTHLAVCHTVVPDFDHKEQRIKYQASSPDELALVDGAAKMGYVFVARTATTIIIKLFGQSDQEWEVMAELPFDSTRKRMSLIVKPPGVNYYVLMTKGADSVMIPRLKKSRNPITKMVEDLDQFAREGLRTLVMGQRMVTSRQFEAFFGQFEAIKSSADPNKETLLGELFNELEKDLDYVGVSAIEDLLQVGVPETIATLMEADIRMWVLTGDKQETAIEIAKSCRLIEPGTTVCILSSLRRQDFTKKLDKYWRDYGFTDLGEDIPPLGELAAQMLVKVSFVIDGQTLAYALESGDDVASKFFRLCILGVSVICCRVSPKQKADVVGLTKKHGPWVTLAIGDGANDVAMIMEAHIGVGLYGKEGSQAARSADFAFGQFRYLVKLILVHGRLAYRRVCWFILYYFYKNVAIVFTEIYFAFFNGFSGQIFFLDWLPMLYNALWTSWPCMFTYALEKDVSKDISLKFPKLYKAGQLGYFFNLRIFWKWLAFAAWHGNVCFWVPVFVKTPNRSARS